MREGGRDEGGREGGREGRPMVHHRSGSIYECEAHSFTCNLTLLPSNSNA